MGLETDRRVNLNRGDVGEGTGRLESNCFAKNPQTVRLSANRWLQCP